MNETPKFSKAFSIVEILAVLAAIGLLAGLAISRVQNVSEASRISKLQSDISTVNQAINIYIANGGRMTDVDSYGRFGDPTEQKVLDKLKTRRNQYSSDTYAGISGEMIDKHVAVRMQDADQASSGRARAVWDSANNRFEIREDGSGVHEFYLSEDEENYDYGVDEGRQVSALDINTEPGWIWAYEETPKPPRQAGTTPVVVKDPSNGGPPNTGGGGNGTPGAGVGGGGGGSPPPPPPPLRGLARPKIVQPSGVYSSSSFPLKITVENPNSDAPESWIMVSVNRGAYQYYEGPFEVSANTTVYAYAAGPPDVFKNSSRDYKYYITRLGKPSFSPWPGSYPMTKYPMKVTMYHRNDPSAWIMYAMNGGPYQRYSTPVAIEAGTALKAYVQTPSDEWVNSAVRSGTYKGYKVDLKILYVDTSASEFDENTDTISVTITQPSGNPSGSSEIRYAITHKDAPRPELASFSAYRGSFDNTYAEYPKGFTVHAYANSLDDEVWNDGPIRSVSTSVDFFGVGVAKSTLFILDFSGSMDQKSYKSTQTRLEVLKSEMRIGLEALSDQDRFGVMIFSSVPLWVTTDGLVQVTSDSQVLKMYPGSAEVKSQVSAVIDSTGDQRYTNFLRALSAVDQVSPAPEQIVFLTDGAPTVGDGLTEDLDNEWLAGLAEIVALGIPIHTIGVDLRKQSELDRLEYMADQTGGTSSLIGDPTLRPDGWAP